MRKQHERDRIDRAGVMKGDDMTNHIEKTICAKAVMAYVEQNMFVWAEFGLPLQMVHQELHELWLKKCVDVEGFFTVAKRAIKKFDEKHADGALQKLRLVMHKRMVDVALWATIDEARYWENLRQSRVVVGERERGEPLDEFFIQAFLSHVRVFEYKPGRPGFGFVALWQPDCLNESRVVEMYNWKVTQPRKFNCSERHWREKILPKRGKFDQRIIEDIMNDCDSGAVESYAVVPLSFSIHHLRLRPRFPHISLYAANNMKWVDYYRFSTHFMNHYRERKAQEVERSVDKEGRKLDDKKNFSYYYCLAYDALNMREQHYNGPRLLAHSFQSYVDEFLMVLARNNPESRKIEMETLRYIAMLGHSVPEAYFSRKYQYLFHSWPNMCVHGCNWLFDALYLSFSGGGVCIDFATQFLKAESPMMSHREIELNRKHYPYGFFAGYGVLLRGRSPDHPRLPDVYNERWPTESMSMWFGKILEDYGGKFKNECVAEVPFFNSNHIIGFGLICDWLWQNVEDMYGLRFCNFEEDHEYEDYKKWNFFRVPGIMPQRSETMCRMHAQYPTAWTSSCIYCRSLKHTKNNTDPRTQLNFIWERYFSCCANCVGVARKQRHAVNLRRKLPVHVLCGVLTI